MTKQLSILRAGESGIIASLNTHEDYLLRRLMAVGFRVGKQIELIRSAIAKGPLHVRVGTTEVMLRREEAQSIEVTLC